MKQCVRRGAGRSRIWLAGGAIAILTAFAAPAPQAQQPTELLIKNGMVVTVEGKTMADVRIRGEKVVEIGANLTAGAGARTIDATGKFLLPGGVDPHVHLSPDSSGAPRPGSSIDDYNSGSAASFAGGVTTIANFVGKTPDEDVKAFADRVTGLVDKNAMADFMLHVNLGNDPSWATLANLNALADRGLVSTKSFMRVNAFDTNIIGYIKAFRASGQAGILSMIHCEDAAMLTELTETMMAEGRGSLFNYPAARPIITEVAATERAVSIAELTGAPVYFVHLSAERALKAAAAGMARGLPIYVETRPLYLHFNEDVYLRPDVGLYIGEPPMRPQADVNALWAGISKGTVHVVSTDHSGFPKEVKLDPKQTIADKRAGMNLLQNYRTMLYSEGVSKGRITIEDFVAVSATNPAKLFGLYPRKGTIAVGSDADIVIWDPTMKRTLKDADELSKTKYTIFNGWDVTGSPLTTIRRGEVVFENGKILAKPASGKFIAGSRFQKPVFRSFSNYTN